MKGYDYKVIPTIVGEKVCVFEFQILCRCFFRKKVVYTGACIVNQTGETFIGGEFIMKPEVQKYIGKAEGTCKTQADFIFKSYEIEKRNEN